MASSIGGMEYLKRYTRPSPLNDNHIPAHGGEQSTRPGCRIVIMIGVASVALGLALSACGPRLASPPSLPALVVGGVDTSPSAREHLPGYARSISRLSGVLSPKRDRIAVFRVDALCAEVYDGAAHGSAERALRSLVPALREEARGTGSRVDAFWSAAAEKVAADRVPSAIAVALATDGFADGVDADGHAEIRKAATRLAADPRVKVVAVVGAATGTREEVRRDLAPLGTRLAFLDPDVAPAAILRALKGDRP
ncbi:MAG: hypothetical protein ACO1SV_07535 [Fimbriimonas sp.]